MKRTFRVETNLPGAHTGWMISWRGSFFVVGAIILALFVWPFHDRYLRFGIPAGSLLIWLMLWFRSRGIRAIRIFLLALPVLAGLPFCLPGRAIDPVELRSDYLASMRKMEGTRYLWGGESRWGIDCSGLPRRGLRDALLLSGFRHANGAAFRMWAVQWWYDTSARAMGEGYRKFTRPLGIRGRLHDLDATHLSAGDLAVTADGRHVMVYAGEGKWIQSDPLAGKVTLGRPGVVENPWFGAEVTMHRWTVLE